MVDAGFAGDDKLADKPKTLPNKLKLE